MKKLAFVAALLILASSLFCGVSAEEDNFKGEVGAIAVPSASPTVDGYISASEGWSAPKYIDKSNMDGFWNGEEIRVSFNYYCAWDKKGFYYAADITMPELVLSTGEDTLDRDNEGNNTMGYNGDVFIIQFDPFARFNYEGLGGYPTSWYCIGVFGNDDVRMIRTQFNKEELTSSVSIAGGVTASGWRFEAFIPWQIISDDIFAASYGEFGYKPDELAKDGTLLNASIIYQDRCFDDEKNHTRSYSRYITICNNLPDGTKAINSAGYYVKACGIYFTLNEKKASALSPSSSQSTNSPAAQQNTAAATGDSSALIPLAAVAALSVVALILLLKNRKNKFHNKSDGGHTK